MAWQAHAFLLSRLTIINLSKVKRGGKAFGFLGVQIQKILGSQEQKLHLPHTSKSTRQFNLKMSFCCMQLFKVLCIRYIHDFDTWLSPCATAVTGTTHRKNMGFHSNPSNWSVSWIFQDHRTLLVADALQLVTPKQATLLANSQWRNRTARVATDISSCISNRTRDTGWKLQV